jgi:AcrR family transcriptional regulator
MQEIADEAGVNKALLHYYFRSKDKLAEAVFRRVALQLMPPMIAILGSDATIEQKVERVVQLELEQLSRSPFLPGYVISELNHNPDRAHQLVTAVIGVQPAHVRPQVVGVLRKQIEERVQAGTMRPIAPEQFLVNLLSMCIFPFAAKPMLGVMLGMDDEGFRQFIESRKTEIPPFFLRALQP